MNLAFEAATADLGNKVTDIRKDELIDAQNFRSSYDKDIENFALLTKMFDVFGKTKELSHVKDPVDMGINRIIDGITDMESVTEACRQEIIARILRYQKEVGSGMEELKTVEIAQEVLGKFDRIYQIKI